MDPKKDIKEDYVKPEIVYKPGHEAEKLPRLNPWQIAFLIFLFIFVLTVGFFRLGFFVLQ